MTGSGGSGGVSVGTSQTLGTVIHISQDTYIEI